MYGYYLIFNKADVFEFEWLSRKKKVPKIRTPGATNTASLGCSFSCSSEVTFEFFHFNPIPFYFTADLNLYTHFIALTVCIWYPRLTILLCLLSCFYWKNQIRASQKRENSVTCHCALTFICSQYIGLLH